MTYENITQIGEGIYQIRFAYLDPLTKQARRVKKRFHGTLEEAAKERERLLGLAREGGLEKDRMSVKTVGELAPAWFEHLATRRKPVQKSQLDTCKYTWKSRLESSVSDWVITEVKRQHVKRLVDSWCDLRKDSGELYSVNTLACWRDVLIRLLKWEFEQVGREDMHILQGITLPSGDKDKPVGRAMRPDESKRLLDYMWDHMPYWYTLAYTSLATGQRFASISALRWVDIDETTITFETSQFRGVPRRGNKSGKVIRLPMQPELWEVLCAHKDYLQATDHPNMETGLIFPGFWKRSGAMNGYLRSHTFGDALKRACEACGIDPVTPHDLRRTANTWMIEAGVSTHLIRAVIGHTADSMTDRYYRASEEAKRDALAHLASSLHNK